LAFIRMSQRPKAAPKQAVHVDVPVFHRMGFNPQPKTRKR